MKLEWQAWTVYIDLKTINFILWISRNNSNLIEKIQRLQLIKINVIAMKSSGEEIQLCQWL